MQSLIVADRIAKLLISKMLGWGERSTLVGYEFAWKFHQAGGWGLTVVGDQAYEWHLVENDGPDGLVFRFEPLPPA